MSTKTTIKVAVYSGVVPSTTFIERLIKGLSEEGVKVLIFGRRQIEKKVIFRNNVVYYSNPSGVRKVFNTLRWGFFLFLRKRKAKKKLNQIIKLKSKNFRQRVHYSAKYYPILLYQPDIFHLQWVKSVNEWMWVQNFGIKLVVSLRGRQVNSEPTVDLKLAEKYQKLFPKIDGFHGVSQAIINEGARYGLPSDKAQVVYSGVNLKEFHFYPQSSRITDRKELNLLSIGRPNWKKGYNYALRAAKILKQNGLNFKYRIVGGAGSEELLFLREMLDLSEEVELLERVTPEIVKELILDSDMFLLSSVEEGIANVVLEAMSMGTPIISTNCGGMAEVIEDQVNGWLVPVRKPEKLAEAVLKIDALSNKEKEQILIRARTKIEQQHSEKKMTRDMIKLYQNVMKQI